MCRRKTPCAVHDRILETIGAEHVRFHDIRHTFTPLLLKSGVNVRTRSEARKQSGGCYLQPPRKRSTTKQVIYGKAAGGRFAQADGRRTNGEHGGLVQFAALTELFHPPFPPILPVCQPCGGGLRSAHSRRPPVAAPARGQGRRTP